MEQHIFLAQQLPTTTVSERLSTSPVVHSSFSTQEVTTTTESIQFNRQCTERQTLAAKHRAEHEMIRKKVLHSIRYALSTLDIESNSKKSHGAIVESTKKWLDLSLESHQETLDDMLGRQTMEAESLMTRQTSELIDKRGGRAPMLHVSFPFPEVFEQARQEMLSILRNR